MDTVSIYHIFTLHELHYVEKICSQTDTKTSAQNHLLCVSQQTWSGLLGIKFVSTQHVAQLFNKPQSLSECIVFTLQNLVI